MRTTKAILLWTLLQFVTIGGFPAASPDSLSLRTYENHFDEKRLTELRNDPRFDYIRGASGLSMWERFKLWIGQALADLLRAGSSANWVNFLTIILVILILVYVVLRLLRIDTRALFITDRNFDASPTAQIVEDIHLMDFDALILEAVQRQNFREATRLTFLHALRLLADANQVKWSPSKTNHDYVRELGKSPLTGDFSKLSHYFEYVCYGNFHMSPALFSRVKTLFEQWRTGMP